MLDVDSTRTKELINTTSNIKRESISSAETKKLQNEKNYVATEWKDKIEGRNALKESKVVTAIDEMSIDAKDTAI